MPPTIRLATPADAGEVQAIYAPFCHTPISFESEPPGVEECAAGWRGARPISLVVERGAWGSSGLRLRHAAPRASGVLLVRRYQRLRPSGPEAAGPGAGLVHVAFGRAALAGLRQRLRWRDVANPASVGLHEAMGFRPVGVYKQVGFKCGAWHDVAWFQRPLQSLPGKPLPPKPLDEVRYTAAWVEALDSGRRLLATDPLPTVRSPFHATAHLPAARSTGSSEMQPSARPPRRSGTRAFLHLYRLLLMLCDDSQAEPDHFVRGADPAMPQHAAPGRRPVRQSGPERRCLAGIGASGPEAGRRSRRGFEGKSTGSLSLHKRASVCRTDVRKVSPKQSPRD